ncbi:MAG: hypothetical protein ISS79_10215 [Phycisphaerae bacterium]|nr:hypothetical protein [Phycisphaerae bacterium]
MKRAIITIAVVIGAGWLCETQAWGVTIPYVFVQDESAVVRTSWLSNPKTYYIEGQFQLNVDFDLGIASFDQVNATLSSEIEYYNYFTGAILFTDNLDELFNISELESTNVTDTRIDFLFEKNIPRFPSSDVYLTVTLLNDTLEMSGYFGEPVADGYWYDLHVIAVPEPGTLLVGAVGAAMLRRRRRL